MEIIGFNVLQKNKVTKEVDNSLASCCGGAPVSNTEACCKLDEEKKDNNEAGCGCSTQPSTVTTSCC